jgi:hypothetical protein
LTALGAALSLVGGHCLFQTPAGTDAGLVLFMIAGVFIGLFLAEILDRIEARASAEHGYRKILTRIQNRRT